MNSSSVQLVFHPVFGTSGQPSTVFADAVSRVLDSALASEIRLVCPYLAHGVVKQLIGKRGFRLVTDFDACFERVEDDRLLDFLADEREFLRHLPDVHAKVICTDAAVFLGSANFTRSGLANRDEMGCIIFDRPLVDQVLNWFEELWNVGQEIQPADIVHIRKHVSTRQRNAAPKPHIIEPQAARSGRATQRSLGWIGELEVSASPVAITGNIDEDIPASDTLAERNELVAHVRKLTRSRAEADRVLTLLARALSIADLPVDDARLHLNFGKEAICVVINQRYVAWCSYERRTEQFGFILDDSELSGPMQQQIEGAWAGSFKRRGQNDLPAFHVPLDRINDLPDALLRSWERAIRMEVGRTRKDGSFYTSSYRKHKRPFLYEALTSENLRHEIARRAFPSFWWFGVNNGSRGHVRLD